MSSTTSPAAGPTPRSGGGWLPRWEPENAKFWSETGSGIAWRTLTVTTVSLVLSFSTWFVMSALTVRMPAVGFKYTTMQLFWLAAMPGLAGGTLRLIHTFLIPIFGTRNVISVATLLKLIPCIWLAVAIQDVETPYMVMMTIAFLLGMGGGDFSSYMPSTSLFFPKRLQGAALGIQAGVGNFGVSLTQFVTPWIISFALLGALGAPQVFKKGEVTKDLWLQNASYWYVPLLAVLGILGFVLLKSVPVTATFRQQLDMFKTTDATVPGFNPAKHTLFCTLTYVMTFGSFAGFSAAFPLMIKQLYAGFEGGPDPLKYAFLGPLVGSTARVVFGFVADKTGGGILTQIAGLGLIGSCVALIFGGYLAPTSLDQFGVFVWLMLAIFLFTGIGNASTFRQYPVIFAHNPRMGAGVIGFTAAIAAYGPFVFSSLIGAAITAKSTATFFVGAAVFYVVATAINWFFYVRKGCERPS